MYKQQQNTFKGEARSSPRAVSSSRDSAGAGPQWPGGIEYYLPSVLSKQIQICIRGLRGPRKNKHTPIEKRTLFPPSLAVSTTTAIFWPASSSGSGAVRRRIATKRRMVGAHGPSILHVLYMGPFWGPILLPPRPSPQLCSVLYSLFARYSTVLPPHLILLRQ